ncbi:MAG TPA: RdgB/HAM1 family non-canonical purine NTP pyrophosphatase [Terriglobales bacterium]|nr:RdgB/HAM1 family non-canonical purine NTP pyrophosphatase [Terriglobales bacterium]
MLKGPISRALLLAGVCLLAIAPFFRWGNPSGHDFEFHMYSWMEVLGQWKHGVVYPRWAALGYWGYGEARFLFYPPASWTLGAALGAVLPWKMVPGAYCWIVLTLAGAAMYRLAREWLSAPDALFAAAFYALNPYHLLIVYWRSAYAELLASALLPLLLLCVLRLTKPGSRPVLWLSLTLAAAWLTNAPAAVMIHYSVAGLAAVLAVLGRSWRPLLRTAVAIALGTGLASFYLIPAVYETRWINVAEVLSPGVRPQDNFLFTTLADPDHNRFNLLVSTVALAEIAVLALSIWGARWKKHVGTAALGCPVAHSATGFKVPWTLLSVWGACSAVLMFSASNLLWQHLPKLQFVQLPFRWLLCMNAALAMLLTLAARRWTWRWLASAVLLAAVIVAGYRIQPPWWELAADIREMSAALADGTGYEGTDEYVPAGADSYELNKSLPMLSDDAGVPVTSQMLVWQPMEKHFRAQSAAAQNLTVRLFNYPAWEVVVNGKRAQTRTTSVTRLLVVPIAAGANNVQIHFRRTLDRWIGDVVSLISLALLVVVWVKSRRRILLATSNAGKLRDFAGAAAPYGVTITNIPNFSSLPQVVEDGTTFEENACKKAESYSRAVPGELVLADDSGLEIDAIGGAPGVHSARYADRDEQNDESHAAGCNFEDEANNARVLRELKGVPEQKRTGRFVCVLAVARDGETVHTFRGAAEGFILDAPRGENGFGYDPLFYFPQIGKTFAELNAEEKARYSHRGAAFRAFLEWYRVADDQKL